MGQVRGSGQLIGADQDRSLHCSCERCQHIIIQLHTYVPVWCSVSLLDCLSTFSVST